MNMRNQFCAECVKLQLNSGLVTVQVLASGASEPAQQRDPCATTQSVQHNATHALHCNACTAHAIHASQHIPCTTTHPMNHNTSHAQQHIPCTITHPVHHNTIHTTQRHLCNTDRNAMKHSRSVCLQCTHPTPARDFDHAEPTYCAFVLPDKDVHEHAHKNPSRTTHTS